MNSIDKTNKTNFISNITPENRRTNKVSRNAISANTEISPTIMPDFDKLKMGDIDKISLTTLLAEETWIDALSIAKQFQLGGHFTLIQNLSHYLYLKCAELKKLDKETLHLDEYQLCPYKLEHSLQVAFFMATMRGIVDEMKNTENNDILNHLNNEEELKNLENKVEKIEDILEKMKNFIEGDYFKNAFLFKYRNLKGSYENRLKQVRESCHKIIDELNLGLSVLWDLYQIPAHQFNTLYKLPMKEFQEWGLSKPPCKENTLKELTTLKEMMMVYFKNPPIAHYKEYEEQLSFILKTVEQNTEKTIPGYLSQALKNRCIALKYNQEEFDIYKEHAKKPLPERNSWVDDTLPYKIIHDDHSVRIIRIDEPSQRDFINRAFCTLNDYCITVLHNDYLHIMEDISLNYFAKEYTFHHSEEALPKLIEALETLKSLFEDSLIKVIPLLGNNLIEKLSSIESLDNALFLLIEDYAKTINGFLFSIHERLDTDTVELLTKYVADISKNQSTNSSWFYYKESSLDPLKEIVSNFNNQLKKLNQSILNELSKSHLYTDEVKIIETSVTEFKREITPLLYPLIELPSAIDQVMTVVSLKKPLPKSKKGKDQPLLIPNLCNINFDKLLKAALTPVKIVPIIEEKPLLIIAPEEPIIEVVEEKLIVEEKKEVIIEVQQEKEEINLPDSHKYKDLKKFLIQEGWVEGKHNSSHIKFHKNNYSFPVPHHQKEPILRPGTFNNILKLKAEKEEQMLNTK